MIQLVLFLLLGVVFAIVLFVFLRKPVARPDGVGEALVSARQALDSLQASLLPSELVRRVFAREDLDFVASAGSRKIRDAFLRERKSIALIWVAQVREQVRSLKRFHSGRSRLYAKLDPRTEIELALRFASLLFVFRLLELTFHVRGPFAAPKLVARVIGVAGNICVVSERSLGFLTVPPSAGRADLLGGNPTGGATA